MPLETYASFLLSKFPHMLQILIKLCMHTNVQLNLQNFQSVESTWNIANQQHRHCVIGLNVKSTCNFSLKCSYSKTKSEVLIWGKIIVDGDQAPDEDEEAMMKLMGFSKFDTTKVWLSIGFVTVGIMRMMLFNDNFAGNSNQLETWNEDNVNCRNTKLMIIPVVMAILAIAN